MSRSNHYWSLSLLFQKLLELIERVNSPLIPATPTCRSYTTPQSVSHCSECTSPSPLDLLSDTNSCLAMFWVAVSADLKPFRPLRMSPLSILSCTRLMDSQIPLCQGYLVLFVLAEYCHFPTGFYWCNQT